MASALSLSPIGCQSAQAHLAALADGIVDAERRWP